jgi:hypothetical protein
MASSLANQLATFFALLGLVALLGALHIMCELRSANRQRRRSQADEEQGRANFGRRSWIFLDDLPRSRSPSRAAMVPNAMPPAYIPRTRQARSPTAAPPRPLGHLPSLDHRYSPDSFPQQQSLPDTYPFVLTGDSTKAPATSRWFPPHARAPFAEDSEGSRAQQSLETALSPLERVQQSFVQTWITFANGKLESADPEVSEVLSPVSMPTSFPVPAATSTQTGMSLSLQAHTRIGTVQVHKPRLVCPANRESDTAAAISYPR